VIRIATPGDPLAVLSERLRPLVEPRFGPLRLGDGALEFTIRYFVVDLSREERITIRWDPATERFRIGLDGTAAGYGGHGTWSDSAECDLDGAVAWVTQKLAAAT
jgi:hypothetical protein